MHQTCTATLSQRLLRLFRSLKDEHFREHQYLCLVPTLFLSAISSFSSFFLCDIGSCLLHRRLGSPYILYYVWYGFLIFLFYLSFRRYELLPLVPRYTAMLISKICPPTCDSAVSLFLIYAFALSRKCTQARTHASKHAHALRAKEGGVIPSASKHRSPTSSDK